MDVRYTTKRRLKMRTIQSPRLTAAQMYCCALMGGVSEAQDRGRARKLPRTVPQVYGPVASNVEAGENDSVYVRARRISLVCRAEDGARDHRGRDRHRTLLHRARRACVPAWDDAGA